MFTEKNTTYQYPRAILSVDLSGENLSDVEFLDDSSTESLLLSGDEYNQDFDSTNFEESQDEDDALNEIVRCICEMDEENGFMIQVRGGVQNIVTIRIGWIMGECVGYRF